MNSHVRPRASIGVGIGLAAALLLAACSTGNEEPSGGDTGDGATSAAGDSCTIGMTQINQTAVFFTQMNEGAQQAADEAGCELTIANANNDSARQSSDIENFVSQGVDAIIVVAIDVNGVKPAVEAARGDGIPVVAIDAELEGVETFVGVDNEAAGKEAGQWLVDEGLADGQRYGVVDAKNSFIQNQREEGFRGVIDAAGAVYTQSVNGDNVQEKAATAAQDLVTAQPDLNFVYTTGEPATVGAVAALQGNTDTVIIGWDLTKEVIAGIDSGLVRAVIQQNPKQEGIEAINELKAILGGAEPQGFIAVPIAIVTKDNVDEYRAIFP
ncbi:substrate-binding domain-containing protein [Georgenia yuyongxinii]|uniref:Sugar ABC transporter substrate-binding protein n=1 Tax=Georgenia yuyongxinii TaxID=2589797 RepID=A0A552WPV1_9MICO|nr:substrate-binding domain-containing protein [Georgenia yuyongxinii]TRW44811.1 sugar ABC transporter substrate-binding protein [Georgenia yuyongxinii]